MIQQNAADSNSNSRRSQLLALISELVLAYVTLFHQLGDRHFGSLKGVLRICLEAASYYQKNVFAICIVVLGRHKRNNKKNCRYVRKLSAAGQSSTILSNMHVTAYQQFSNQRSGWVSTAASPWVRADHSGFRLLVAGRRASFATTNVA